ncbi:hypothetical protein QTN25_005459 [Entamoeba marina]
MKRTASEPNKRQLIDEDDSNEIDSISDNNECSHFGSCGLDQSRFILDGNFVGKINFSNGELQLDGEFNGKIESTSAPGLPCELPGEEDDEEEEEEENNNNEKTKVVPPKKQYAKENDKPEGEESEEDSEEDEDDEDESSSGEERPKKNYDPEKLKNPPAECQNQ